MEFKEKLKKLRAQRGISQQALADAIFVSRSAIAKWENGLGLPSDASYEALTSYFGVGRDALKTDEPEVIIVQKNKRMRRLSTLLGAVGGVFLIVVVLLPVVIAMSGTYGLTSQIAANAFDGDPFIHTEEYDIYYTTMELHYGEDVHTFLSHFRPYKKLWVGYGLYEEGYTYRELYYDGNFLGRLYSLEGEECYYNIILMNANIRPVDAISFDKIIANGKEHSVDLSSYFVTEEKPVGTMLIGEAHIEIATTEKDGYR